MKRMSLPECRAPKATFHALQEWEGYVVEIGETDFVARLIDLTAGWRRGKAWFCSRNDDRERGRVCSGIARQHHNIANDSVANGIVVRVAAVKTGDFREVRSRAPPRSSRS